MKRRKSQLFVAGKCFQLTMLCHLYSYLIHDVSLPEYLPGGPQQLGESCASLQHTGPAETRYGVRVGTTVSAIKGLLIANRDDLTFDFAKSIAGYFKRKTLIDSKD
jgi:hypothetical protein